MDERLTAGMSQIRNSEEAAQRLFSLSLSLSLHPLMITQTEANLQSKFIDAPPLTRLS